MIDVLFASKKYLMAKLTRYCYEFIQKNITAEKAVSLWYQVWADCAIVVVCDSVISNARA